MRKSLLIFALLVGCNPAPDVAGGRLAFGPPPLLSPDAFVAHVDNEYFPLTPGTVLVYEGDDDGEARRDEVRVQHQPRAILGVACTAVEQIVFHDGELTEMTTEWYAQDLEGNVWKFGEDSQELDGAVFVPATDSWVAGENGALPWMVIRAVPQIGDVHVGNTADGFDRTEVISVTAVVATPAGVFENCLQVVENATPDDDDEDDDQDDPNDTDIILYGQGVGLVSEQHAHGRIDLVSYGTE